MDSIQQRIWSQARYLGKGIVRLDSILNHQVDSTLMTDIGRELAQLLGSAAGVSKVLTAETSGIAPALTTAQALGVPMLFARKKPPVTLAGACYRASARSHTKGDMATLHVAAEYLGTGDRVVIVDDFLGTGETALAMLDLVRQSGATLCGMGYVVEKVYEQGRVRLAGVQEPIVSLVKLDIVAGDLVLV